jgi:ubiquinone/menaquinone biosynthesis C-methylase UbiE
LRTLERGVKAYYDARAREYDDWWLGDGVYAPRMRPGWDEARRALEDAIRALPPARTLDVACGTGFLTRHLRGEVVGLDQSENMLAVARRQSPEATFVRGDALELPFEDGSFDRVFASYFYCHLEEPERRQFLSEARRVAPELVVVGSLRREGLPPARWEERELNDGSRWEVYKRFFEPELLLEELGAGRVLFTYEDFFLMVASP